MKKERRDDSFLKKPWYNGGQKAMDDFIKSNLAYPQNALDEKIEGTVHLRLEIDFQGHVVDAKILSGIGHGCDEEAIRVVKLMKFEVEKTPRKLKVTFHKKLSIHFKLPRQKDADTFGPALINSSISYEVVSKSANNDTKPDNKPQSSKTYTYTLKY